MSLQDTINDRAVKIANLQSRIKNVRKGMSNEQISSLEPALKELQKSQRKDKKLLPPRQLTSSDLEARAAAKFFREVKNRGF